MRRTIGTVGPETATVPGEAFGPADAPGPAVAEAPRGGRGRPAGGAREREPRACRDEARSAGRGLETRRPRIRVLVMGDDAKASRALRLTLEQADAQVIADAPCGPAALELARRYAPDIVVVDVQCPELEALALTEALTGMELGIRPILLTVGRDPDAGLAAIRAGARGYLRRSDLLSPSLPRLLSAVMADELVCSRGLMTAIVDRLVRTPLLGEGYRPVRSPLTSREWEVLDLLCLGGSTDAIADELVISTETVRTHLKNVMRKLGASSRAEVVALAGRLRGSRGG